MRMAAIMLLLLASLCAAAPFSANLDKSKIAKEASQEDIVANDNVKVDLEVHYHGSNVTDLNREGKFQLTFGDVEVLNSPFAVNFGNIKVTHTRGTDGGWSTWGEFSSCSATCGSATKKRERTCTDPVPANGGVQCPGPNQETVDCALQDCATTTTTAAATATTTTTAAATATTTTAAATATTTTAAATATTTTAAAETTTAATTDPVLIHTDENYEYYKIPVPPSSKMTSDVVLSTCSENSMKPQCMAPTHGDDNCVEEPKDNNEPMFPRVLSKILCPSVDLTYCSFMDNMFWYMKPESGWNEGSAWGQKNGAVGNDYTSTSDIPYFAACVKSV